MAPRKVRRVKYLANSDSSSKSGAIKGHFEAIHIFNAFIFSGVDYFDNSNLLSSFESLSLTPITNVHV
jgi:hypothetical protein